MAENQVASDDASIHERRVKVSWLLKRHYRADEIAKAVGASINTVYRDIQAIKVAWRRLYSEAWADHRASVLAELTEAKRKIWEQIEEDRKPKEPGDRAPRRRLSEKLIAELARLWLIEIKLGALDDGADPTGDGARRKIGAAVLKSLSAEDKAKLFELIEKCQRAEMAARRREGLLEFDGELPQGDSMVIDVEGEQE